MSASDETPSTPLSPPPPGWMPWQSTQDWVSKLPGHKERVTCEAWFDREQGSLMLVVTQYDESMSETVPCWQQLHLIEAGPFFARNEVRAVSEIWADTVVHCWLLPD